MLSGPERHFIVVVTDIKLGGQSKGMADKIRIIGFIPLVGRHKNLNIGQMQS